MIPMRTCPHRFIWPAECVVSCRRLPIRQGPVSVMELLTDAARREGTTVILVTHEARVAAYAARRVIVRDGTLTVLDTVAP
jgi:ABC-type enterochelin transport system ATPase subunit